MRVPVWLFAPNLIGYARVALLVAAVLVSTSPARTDAFFALYFLSYALDAVDGPVARALGQTTRFGAVLDKFD